MQYFHDRAQAGAELSKKLQRYRNSSSVIITLSPGGVLVGQEIAKQLNLPMGMLAIEEVRLPWALGPLMGAVNSSGEYSKNELMNESVYGNYVGEFHSFLDQRRLELTHKINMMHVSKVMNRNNLSNKTVILVDDGMSRTTAIQQAMNYLKPVKTTRIIAACAVSKIDVIDYLHLEVDEIYCLSVKNNYVTTDHYFDDEKNITYEKIVEILDIFDNIHK